jgi:hypothetical protein
VFLSFLTFRLTHRLCVSRSGCKTTTFNLARTFEVFFLKKSISIRFFSLISLSTNIAHLARVQSEYFNYCAFRNYFFENNFQILAGFSVF